MAAGIVRKALNKRRINDGVLDFDLLSREAPGGGAVGGAVGGGTVGGGTVREGRSKNLPRIGGQTQLPESGLPGFAVPDQNCGEGHVKS